MLSIMTNLCSHTHHHHFENPDDREVWARLC